MILKHTGMCICVYIYVYIRVNIYIYTYNIWLSWYHVSMALNPTVVGQGG